MADLEENAEAQMELWEHLDDLRGVFLRVLIVTTILTGVVFSFIEPVVKFLQGPLLEVLEKASLAPKLYYTGIGDKFFVYLKVSVGTALALASPYLLYEIWRFVKPALHEPERKVVLPFILFGSLSFVAGLCFAFFLVIPASYEFLINFGSPEDEAIITLTEYFSLTVKLLLGLGLVFELPVVLVFLGVLGVINAALLERNRKYALFAIAVASAAITPTPDALTMLMVMGPLYMLYEVSILGIKIVERGKPKEI